MIFSEYFYKLLEENDAKRSYGCLMLDCSELGKKVEALQSNIEPEDIYEEDGHGLEKDAHITVLYGFHEQDGQVIKNSLEFSPIEYELTGLSLFENDDFDVLKFTVKSKDLKKLNKECSDTFENTNDYPDYIPHMTVAYLLPGTGKKYVKLKSPIIDKSFTSGKFIFSTKDSEKTKWKV